MFMYFEYFNFTTSWLALGQPIDSTPSLDWFEVRVDLSPNTNHVLRKIVIMVGT
jgi:hypothetical protein